MYYFRKRTLGRLRKFGDNIKVDLREEICEEGRWMGLAQFDCDWWAVVVEALNIQVLLSVIAAAAAATTTTTTKSTPMKTSLVISNTTLYLRNFLNIDNCDF
jgi:hypothetical protein